MNILRRLVVALGLASPVMGAAPHAAATARLSFEESWRRLQTLDLVDKAAPPFMRDRRPEYGDELLGLEFFRTDLADADLSGLTLPRTYFGRSDIRNTSFRNTDLSESNLCWNDFSDVDFSRSILADSDMRRSGFHRVTFAHADLRRADLRGSGFLKCSFVGANLAGAIVAEDEVAGLGLTAHQVGTLDRRSGDFPEPDGG